MFDDLAAIRYQSFNITDGGEAERVIGASASASLLPVLGVQPILGRASLDEDRPPPAPGEELVATGGESQSGGDAQKRITPSIQSKQNHPGPARTAEPTPACVRSLLWQTTAF